MKGLRQILGLVAYSIKGIYEILWELRRHGVSTTFRILKSNLASVESEAFEAEHF